MLDLWSPSLLFLRHLSKTHQACFQEVSRFLLGLVCVLLVCPQAGFRGHWPEPCLMQV